MRIKKWKYFYDYALALQFIIFTSLVFKKS